MAKDKSPWEVVSAALMARLGWNLVYDGSTDAIPEWHFGLDGAALLVITADRDVGLVLYDSANDSELTFYDAGGLMAWLDLHESEYEGFTELQMKLMGDLLPKVVKEWAEEDGSSA